MYDIIGDIHGYASELKLLLKKLGYSMTKSHYAHPQRKAIFCGDFVDRGVHIRETLQIVHGMVSNKAALSVMGNHEFNAISYHMQNTEGEYLREHSEKNRMQHQATLDAFRRYPHEWEMYINWFKRLPLFLDLGNLRVVHATWDFDKIDFLKSRLGGNRLNNSFLLKASRKGTPEFEAIDIVLKGKEIDLPKGLVYHDKDVVIRKKIRVKWWKELKNTTYRSIAVDEKWGGPRIAVPSSFTDKHKAYGSNEPPVLFGHYWQNGTPKRFAKNVACLDYSIAKKGKLTAYRWDGEQEINNYKFLSVNVLDDFY